MAENPTVPGREQQAAYAKAVGERLRAARLAAGMSQLQAAQRIGYANSTKLSKIESGKHSSQIPMWALKRAAEVYGVSLGRLMLAEHLDGRGCADRVQRIALDLYERDARQISSLLHLVETEHTDTTIAVRELSRAFDRFTRQHPRLPGLTALSNAVSEVLMAHHQREKAISRPVQRVYARDINRVRRAFA